MAMEQLLFSGILEAVNVRHQGYALRLSFEEFIEEYKCVAELLGGKRFEKNKLDAKALVALLPGLVGNGVSPPDLVVGKTKVFAKTGAATKLNKGRERAIAKFALKVQAHFRAVQANKRVNKIKQLNNKVQPLLKEFGALGPDGKAVMPDGCISDWLGTPVL